MLLTVLRSLNRLSRRSGQQLTKALVWNPAQDSSQFLQRTRPGTLGRECAFQSLNFLFYEETFLVCNDGSEGDTLARKA